MRSRETSRCRPTCSRSSPVGEYNDIRRARAADVVRLRADDDPYDPDFNTKSLRGNIVMRWEYLPGSTLFVVWDLRQSDYSRPGLFSPWRDLGSAFGADATHVLMVKVSYWLNR
jgi:hypothetical protein